MDLARLRAVETGRPFETGGVVRPVGGESGGAGEGAVGGGAGRAVGARKCGPGVTRGR